eukprot:COSAG01_NODE_14310_length_1470_cov_11.169949_1_plen_275_part_00
MAANGMRIPAPVQQGGCEVSGCGPGGCGRERWVKRTTRPFWFYAGDTGTASQASVPIDIAAMFEGSVDAKYLPPAWSAERDSATGVSRRAKVVSEAITALSTAGCFGLPCLERGDMSAGAMVAVEDAAGGVRRTVMGAEGALNLAAAKVALRTFVTSTASEPCKVKVFRKGRMRRAQKGNREDQAKVTATFKELSYREYGKDLPDFLAGISAAQAQVLPVDKAAVKKAASAVAGGGSAAQSDRQQQPQPVGATAQRRAPQLLENLSGWRDFIER